MAKDEFLTKLALYLQVKPEELFPEPDLMKAQEKSTRLEKKLSNSEVSNNAESVQKLKDFIRFFTSNPKQ